jgi:glycosyltransferase involved in cell wall biosynthesis
VSVLGIGVITRNRLPVLGTTIAELARRTTAPYLLVVADDGSEDGTAEWTRGAGLALVSGPRRGCAWNKNRALLYLMTQAVCDPILLLEDDTRPTRRGWQDEWIAAARRWFHVNYCYAFPATDPPPGGGTAQDPYRCAAFGGHCTITARSAILEVGYLDPRFHGCGWEHVEWTWRFHLSYQDRWGLVGELPCLDHGVAATWPKSLCDPAEREANEATYAEIRTHITGPYACEPWCDQDERVTLTREIMAAARPAEQVAGPRR